VSDVLVLCYHALSRRWPASLSTTPERFEEQVRLLLDRGYRATTFERAVTGPPASRTLAITFDDAYGSVFELAFPLLRGLGVPATVFVPTAFAGSSAPMSWPGIDQWLDGAYEAELGCMSWEQLAELGEAGWEVGSHTHTHPRLPELSDDALAGELGRSREICGQRLDRPCRSLAYPYGAHDERVVAAAGAAGYSAAGTLPAAFHSPDRLRWPRVGVYHADDLVRFRLKASPALRRLRTSRLWEPLTSIRGG
jgi:peptidoglycan/xylan/chitin deacetylase (PgdA/CDA1 family)